MWNAQKYYLVNGIQGLKLNSKAGNSPVRSRPPSRSKSALGDNAVARKTPSRPPTAKTTPDHSKAISSDALDGDVIIHVFDEPRNAKRDFYCEKRLLLSEMTYFTNHIMESKSPCEIDVHCDIEIFEWLMNYIAKKGDGMTLECNTVVSLLISSSFLKMEKLEDQCLKFIHGNINQVIEVPIDLRCIPARCIKSLAKLFSVDDLSLIEDPKNKIEDQLYHHSLSELLQDSSLVKCKLCSRILSSDFYSDTNCDKAELELDDHGQIIRNHTLDESFDINEFIVALYLSCKSWKHVYWRIWAIRTRFECKECNNVYSGSEFMKCLRHTEEPAYNSEGLEGRGVYTCCNKVVLKFMPCANPHGCHFFPHEPIKKSGKSYNLFLKNIQFISWKSSAEEQDPIKISAAEILAPEKKLFHIWVYSSKNQSTNSSFSDKIKGKVSYTESQFDQKRKDEQKLQEIKNIILQSR